ncbi:MAG: DUF4126 domain-containing protein [Anaerolineae bacterium]
MIQSLASIATAFGLSAATGLNAYIPLLIVALVARFTDWLVLEPPYDVLTSPWVIGALIILAGIEFFADKIPGVDHMNDLVGTFVRPAAGAILFAATTGAVHDMSPVLAVICGLVITGTVHAAKAGFRPIVTASTAGVGNPVVSTAEDITATIVSFGAILLPFLFALMLLIALTIVAWLIYSWRRRASRPSSA